MNLAVKIPMQLGKEKITFAEVQDILNTIGKRINSGKTVDGEILLILPL